MGKKVLVRKGHVHPMWSAKKKDHPFDYDFQLLELSEPLKFDENIQSIKIAHIEDMVIGKVITVTGWGNTEENVSRDFEAGNDNLDVNLCGGEASVGSQSIDFTLNDLGFNDLEVNSSN